MPSLAAENRPLALDGLSGNAVFLPVAARVLEGMSQISEITVDAVCADKTVDLHALPGKAVMLTVRRARPPHRHFAGIIIRVEALGSAGGYALYRFEIRSSMWLLTRDRDIHLYQDSTLPEILRDITDDISSLVSDKITEETQRRVLCTRFFETRFAFLSRLMEEEGVYWFNDSGDGSERIIVTDTPGTHRPIGGEDVVPFRDVATNTQSEHIHVLDEIARPETMKQTFAEYDFERPRANMTAAAVSGEGRHSPPLSPSSYGYLGHYGDVAVGERYARIRTEAQAAARTLWSGVSNQPHLAVGRTFGVDRHPRIAPGARFLVTRTRHEFQIDRRFDPTADIPELGARRLLSGMRENELVRVAFDALPVLQQFRAPHVTPWPRVPGILTAVVTGPQGEEIHTDEYGRIRIRFHYDYISKPDERATCWVRHVTPWAGKTWGMIHIPRIGQEVVVQFEEGNPDRPIVTGMLYNGENMPPYKLDADKTQSGIRTNSSKGGGGFNELMFEDKKDKELVRFQAERDYRQIVKNNATITVGLEKKAPGDLSLTIQNDWTETLKEGNHSRTIERGDQTLEISEGRQTETIKGNVTREVLQGSVTQKIRQGDLSTTLDRGSETRTLSMGDLTTRVDMGSVSTEAMQKIELKVGGNSITIDQSGITIKGIMIKIEGSAMLEAKSPMSTVKGDAILILKGGMTMIN